MIRWCMHWFLSIKYKQVYLQSTQCLAWMNLPCIYSICTNVALWRFENGWCASAWIFCTSVFLCIFCICIIWSFCEGPRMDDASAEQDAVFQIFSGWHFVYFVFAGSAPLLLGCSENGWCALASLKAAINWMSPQGKRQTWRRTLYPQDKYWCSHCCQTNTHDCHWFHTFQMYLQPHWWTYRGCYSHFMNVTTEQCLQTTNMTTGFNCWKCTSFTSVL